MRKPEPLLDTKKILQELQTHQAELQMQNEELRQAQLNLEMSRNNYFELYNFAPVAYLTLSESGTILEANLTACDFLKMNKQLLIGKSFYSFIPQSDRNIFFNHLERVLKTGERQVEELKMTPSNSPAPLYIQIQSEAVSDSFPSLRMALIDITVRHENQTQLQKLNEDLEIKVKERTALIEAQSDKLRRLILEVSRSAEGERRRLAQLLHDHLQQLMVAAKFNAGAISKVAKKTSFQKNEINQYAQEISALIGQAIEVSRSLTVELCPPVLYEAGLFAALEWLARWMAEKYQLQVHVEGEKDYGAADEIQSFLFQAMRELLLNIAKHAKVKTAWVTLEKNENFIIAIVEDHGRGFDPVLDPQKEPSHFGLFHLRERILLLGGHMEIKAEPGKGTRVELYLPYHIDQIAAHVESSFVPLPKTVHKSGTIRVLVVDDHTLFRQGLTTMLAQDSAMEVIGEAEDGKKAVELAERLVPDVILMDINMPEINGIEATRLIKQRFQNINIIGLSFHNESEVKKAMHEAGACAYIEKTSAAEDLVSTIHSLYI